MPEANVRGRGRTLAPGRRQHDVPVVQAGGQRQTGDAAHVFAVRPAALHPVPALRGIDVEQLHAVGRPAAQRRRLDDKVRLGRAADRHPQFVAAHRRAARLAPLVAERQAHHTRAAPALAVAGGVGANAVLRGRLLALCEETGVAFAAPPPALCTDNGAMIAWAGIERRAAGIAPSAAITARPRWPLDEGAAPLVGSGLVSVDSGGLITAWTAQAERTFGWHRGEVIGHPLVATTVAPHQRQRGEQHVHLGR